MSDQQQRNANSKLVKTFFREDYGDNFSPVVYLNRFRNLEQDWLKFHIDNGFEYIRDEAISGNRLLDLGCGASLLSMIAAPDHFTHIVMADYTNANLEVIRKWTSGDDMGFDWDPVCHYYSQKHKLGQSWGKTRLATLKSCIKDVVCCDVQQSEPLGPTYTGFFDCVVSAFCLEVAVQDIAGYNQSVKNTASLIRDGGHLVMRGSLYEEGYLVEGKNFYVFPLTAQQLITALAEAGLKLLEIKVDADCDPMDIMEDTGFCLLAQKVST